MLGELIKERVYYKIFDRSFKQSSHIYARYKTRDATKLAEIDENLQAVKKEFSCNNLLILNQVHGNVVIDADSLENFNSNPMADGVVTTKKDLILSVLTADCVPVLIASEDGSLIGAAHCGWRSAKGNIIDALVEKMYNKGGRKFKALIGPAIQQKSYEVDRSYYESFIADDTIYHEFFITSKNEGHFMFNLPAFVYSKLESAGVVQIDKIAEDTYSNPDIYPSFRRDCHEGRKYSQNILSTLVIG